MASIVVSQPPAASSAPRSYSRSRSLGGRRRKSYGRRSYGRRTPTNYRVRAAARRGYIRGKWPISVYAHPYIARGSAAAQALGFTPGQTFGEASAAEQAARRQAGWYGRGQYMNGRGGYFGKALGGFVGGSLGALSLLGSLSKGQRNNGAAAALTKAGMFVGDRAGDAVHSLARKSFICPETH